ncbi:MAG: MarR family transcriptional regulator [Clostridia bacterium]|nr:MarR family transcriptional regulator [Clostridia bacterium]
MARYVGIFNRQTQAYITAAFRDVDINFSEHIILMNLYENEGINQEELSSLLLIDKALTARTVKSLEEKGYVIRKVAEDRRFKKLFLTDKAKSQKEYFYSLLKKWEDYTTDWMNQSMKNQVFKGLQTMAEKSASADFAELIKKEEI